MEYIEREDEFDIQPLEEIHKRRLDMEDEDVDVLTVDPVKGDFDPSGFRMPVLLDIDASDSEDDIIAIGAGQFRRKSPGRGQEWMNETGSSGTIDERKGTVNGTARSQNGTKRRRAEG